MNMSRFKRASLAGSEELFRPTRPEIVEPEEAVTEVTDRTVVEPLRRRVSLAQEEIELLLEAVQVAKFPERARPKPPLDRFQRLDALKTKLQAELPG